MSQALCTGGSGFGSCRDARDSELCATCEAHCKTRTVVLVIDDNNPVKNAAIKNIKESLR